jgi:hypothetical protein
VSANEIDAFIVPTGKARDAAGIQRAGNVVVQAVSQVSHFKNCSYFFDTGDKRVFCVHTEEAKQGFLARGFFLAHQVHSKMTAAATERAKALRIPQPPDWYKLASDLANAPSRSTSNIEYERKYSKYVKYGRK